MYRKIIYIKQASYDEEKSLHMVVGEYCQDMTPYSEEENLMINIFHPKVMIFCDECHKRITDDEVSIICQGRRVFEEELEDGVGDDGGMMGQLSGKRKRRVQIGDKKSDLCSGQRQPIQQQGFGRRYSRRLANQKIKVEERGLSCSFSSDGSTEKSEGSGNRVGRKARKMISQIKIERQNGRQKSSMSKKNKNLLDLCVGCFHKGLLMGLEKVHHQHLNLHCHSRLLSQSIHRKEGTVSVPKYILQKNGWYRVRRKSGLSLTESQWNVRSDLLFLDLMKRFNYGNWYEIYQKMLMCGMNIEPKYFKKHFRSFYKGWLVKNDGQCQSASDLITGMQLNPIRHRPKEYGAIRLPQSLSMSKSSMETMVNKAVIDGHKGDEGSISSNSLSKKNKESKASLKSNKSQKPLTNNISPSQAALCQLSDRDFILTLLRESYDKFRGEFEIEYDHEAEFLVEDLEFRDDDTKEQRKLKLRMLCQYNERIRERQKRKQYMNEFQFMLKENQTVDMMQIIQSNQQNQQILKPFMRYFNKKLTEECSNDWKLINYYSQLLGSLKSIKAEFNTQVIGDVVSQITQESEGCRDGFRKCTKTEGVSGKTRVIKRNEGVVQMMNGKRGPLKSHHIQQNLEEIKSYIKAAEEESLQQGEMRVTRHPTERVKFDKRKQGAKRFQSIEI